MAQLASRKDRAREAKLFKKEKNCFLKKITSVSKHAVCVSIHFHVLPCLFTNSQHSRDQAL